MTIVIFITTASVIVTAIGLVATTLVNTGNNSNKYCKFSIQRANLN